MGRFLEITVPSEPLHEPGLFHLTDPDEDGKMAYSYEASPDSAGLALADVASAECVRFTPIDFNPDFEALEQTRNRRCDGYLRTDDANKLVFVELKNRDVGNATSTKSWIEKAIKQLRLTIVLFRREEPEKARLDIHGYHRAYVCNPKGPYQVPESVRSVKKMFLTATRTFVLYCNNKITMD